MFWENPEVTRLIREKYRVLTSITGFSHEEAWKTAKELVDRAQELCKKRGVLGRKPNPLFLFEAAKEDEEVRGYLKAIMAEGVRDEDIKEWHSISYLERAAMEVDDEFFRMACFLHHLENGESPAKAAKAVKRIHPIYGDPREGKGDDRPLPIELKLRELRWREKQYADPDAFRARVNRYSSYNAMVRVAVRRGEL